MPKLTIAEVLNKGIDAHKNGKLNEADKFYTSILEVQPRHPDANHNIGVLGVAVGKPDIAIPYFKVATEVNPKEPQYWISYIEALINQKKFLVAEQAFNNIPQEICHENRINVLRDHLNVILSADVHDDVKPSEQTYFIEHEPLKMEAMQKDVASALEHISNDLTPVSVGSVDPLNELINPLVQLVEAGDLGKAFLHSFDVLLQFPNSAIMNNLVGVILTNLNQLSQARVCLERAIGIHRNFPEAFFNLGNVHREAMQLDLALDCYKNSLKLNENNADVHCNIGSVHLLVGNLSEAHNSYAASLEIDKNHVAALTSRGVVFQELGKMAEAIDAFESALAIEPTNISTSTKLGILYFETRNYREAIPLLKRDEAEYSQMYLLKSYFELEQKDEFFAKLDDLERQGINNSVIGSLVSRANLKYDCDRHNIFCNRPLEYVRHVNILNDCSFETTVIEVCASVLENSSVKNRFHGLLSNGMQTSGNLFLQEMEKSKGIQSLIRQQVNKYLSEFEGSTDGLITQFPVDYGLNGWIVKMKSGGSLDSHIHESGWISGSLYVNVPKKKKLDSGNLVVSLDKSKKANSNMVSIDVRTGSLCLFPSSLLHYTIPFEADEDRIVLAFDVVPNKKAWSL